MLEDTCFFFGGDPQRMSVINEGHQKSLEEGLSFNWQVKAVLCFHETCPSKASGAESSVSSDCRRDSG